MEQEIEHTDPELALSTIHKDKLVPELRSSAEKPLNDSEFQIIDKTLDVLKKVTDEEDDYISTTLENGGDPYYLQLSRRLLTPEEEVIVSRALYRSTRECSIYTAMLNNDSLDTSSRNSIENRLNRVQSIQEESRKQLIVRNMRLASSVAEKYFKSYPQIPRIDLTQEATIGLMRAVKDFNPTLGNRFSTYATWWIRQSVGRYVANTLRIVRVPVHMHDTINKVRKTANRLEIQNEHEATTEEVADELGINIYQVESALDAQHRTSILSLNKIVDSVDGGGDTELGDLLPDTTMVDFDEGVYENELKNNVDDALNCLTARERQVIELRFGLSDNSPHTLDAISKELHVSRERIRQIEKKALLKLRHPSRGNKLKKYLE